MLDDQLHLAIKEQPDSDWMSFPFPFMEELGHCGSKVSKKTNIYDVSVNFIFAYRISEMAHVLKGMFLH